MDRELAMNPNVLVSYLGKPAKEFTKEDIIRYIDENGIQMVNFMYLFIFFYLIYKYL
jgi:glutamine synthetase